MKSKVELSSCQNLQEVLDWASSFLAERNKASHDARWLLFEKYGRSLTDLLLDRQMLTPEELDAFETDIELLAADVPPQYLAGHAWFYNRSYLVDERVLIPRPETEEWVDRLLSEHGEEDLNVLDIGTGSGAIALTLKLERPSWQVTAVDISADALEVSRLNAQRLGGEVDFIQSDLTAELAGGRFDLIVSNPPYIAEEEWTVMSPSVRKYEPQLALYAEDHGLAVYQRLAQELPPILKANGQIYLEIGYRQGLEVSEMMNIAFPDKEIELIQDLSGQDRLVWVHEKKA